VANKIKSTLSEACLDHILTVEGNKWLQCERSRVSPRFHCTYNPRATGLVERSNATLKQIISKLIADMPSTWHKVLCHVEGTRRDELTLDE
jgi:hypothetical protein